MSNVPSDKNFIFLKSAKKGDDFVGIKITENEREITFPMGYVPASEKLSASKILPNERRKIINLINAICNCKNFKKGGRISSLNGKITCDFPIKSAIYIIEDFLDRGSYYTEKETLYINSTSGKISWTRTIKNIKPIISESGIAFLNFISRKNRIQENQLITEIHKYCVHKTFELLGFLFTSSLPEKGLLQESDISKNKKYYADFLQEKIDSTHLEANIELFSNMKDFINGFDSESEIKNAAYGTQCFQVVWESLIEKMFSTINKKQKETYFYPQTRWILQNGRKITNAPLRPDTIMIQDEKCFVIDAKYYSFAALVNHNSENADDENTDKVQNGSIPGSDSIQKQITYAEFIDSSIDNNKDSKDLQKFRFEPRNIHNVFILPESNAEKLFCYKGYATSNWKDNSKNYHKIHAITLDPRFLLENAGKKSTEMKRRLVEICEFNL